LSCSYVAALCRRRCNESFNNGFFTDTFIGVTLSGDVSGDDGVADFEIVMIGIKTLIVSDFTL
jgi:hypothetical protein